MRFYYDAKKGKYMDEPDGVYLRRMYKALMGKELNLEQPITFNEKLQWLKIHNRKPEYPMMVDKYEAKQYVTSLIGEKYIIPTYGVWNKFEDISFKELPNRFVLKCTHDSGGLVICKDKSTLKFSDARKKIEKSLKFDFYSFGREWPYKNVKPRIIAEQYMEDETNKGGLTDYKIHCFNGEPKVIQVISDRFSHDGMINDHYYPTWEKLDLVRGHHATSNKSIPRPNEMDEMLGLAKTLSVGIPYLRTDFYIVNHQIYFGELTFFPASGFNPFHPEKWDYVWGDWIKLPTDGNT
ncbi:MAG: glycosyl transferase [Oscillospiraceae bacterium]|nr:glycosyl transferase [Oscillospiraceae bacterium]